MRGGGRKLREEGRKEEVMEGEKGGSKIKGGCREEWREGVDWRRGSESRESGDSEIVGGGVSEERVSSWRRERGVIT